MDKIQKSAVIAVLFLSLAVIVMGALPATAAEDVVVTRGLPDEPVGPKPEVITVTLTQSGFFQIGDVGWVNETLPEGFTYVVGSVVDGDGYAVVIDEDYMETTDKITIPFGTSENTTTMTYKVEADTAEHIRDAEFAGTWTTISSLGPPVEYQTGEVTGDIKLTAAEEEPTPTPGNGNGGNGGGGGGDGGATTPTPTPGETPTTSPTSGATATPVGSFTPTPTGVPTSTPTQSPSPTKKPLIPGFEAVFAIAGLLAVTYLVIQIRR